MSVAETGIIPVSGVGAVICVFCIFSPYPTYLVLIIPHFTGFVKPERNCSMGEYVYVVLKEKGNRGIAHFAELAESTYLSTARVNAYTELLELIRNECRNDPFMSDRRYNMENCTIAPCKTVDRFVNGFAKPYRYPTLASILALFDTDEYTWLVLLFIPFVLNIIFIL